MNSFRFGLYSKITRWLIKPWVARVKDPIVLRRAFERQAKRAHISPAFADYRNGSLGGIDVKWVSCGPVCNNDILFYVHGGGFIAGSPNTHKHMVAGLCKRLGMEAVMPNYRLAPENPFPAGFKDVLDAYLGLVATGRRPEQIILGGDSAGGCLVLGLLAWISENDLPLPQSAFVLSPVVDQTAQSRSLIDNADTECVLVAHRFEELAQMYMGETDRKDPFASPAFAQFDRCPPILFHVSDYEILRDDTLLMQTLLTSKGHTVSVQSWPNAFHVFHIMTGHFPEAGVALDDVADFIKQH